MRSRVLQALSPADNIMYRRRRAFKYLTNKHAHNMRSLGVDLNLSGIGTEGGNSNFTIGLANISIEYFSIIISSMRR